MNKHWKFAAPILLALQVAFASERSSLAHAQELTVSQTKTRIELIVEQQKQKARNLQPAKPHEFERVLQNYVGNNPLNKYIGGIKGMHLRFGGMPSGAGLAVGPEYFRPDLAKGQMSFRASAVGSKRLWYMIETELRFPHLARQYLDLRFLGRRLNATSFDYYGPGPESKKAERSLYRREENSFDASLALRPTPRYLTIGFAFSYLWINVDPGKSALYHFSEKQYPPSVTPGIDRRTNYLRAGPFLEADSRDKPKDPHEGTHFLVRFNHYSDRKHGQYSFRQIDGSIEQYLPFFNKKRVIALRACSVLSYPDTGSEIPFYMQPTLGGTSDLRGYRRYRFYDRNLFLFSAEYRWEVFTLMDAALFIDAGKVFHMDGDFNLENLKSDGGFGFRFKTRQAVVFRIDTAFSHEGFGLWFTFDHVF